jgi:hypothetical protein
VVLGFPDPVQSFVEDWRLSQPLDSA